MRFLLILGAAALLAACAAKPARPAPDWQTAHAEGENLAAAGRFADAEKQLALALQTGGDDPAALIRCRSALARLAIRQGHFPAGLSNLSATGAAGARAPEVLLARGEYFLAIGRYAAARSVLAPALTDPATAPAAAFAMATVALAEGDYRAAAKRLDGTTAGAALVLRGEAALAAGAPDTAAAFFADAERDLAAAASQKGGVGGGPAEGPDGAALARGRARLALRTGEVAAGREALKRARHLETAMGGGTTPGALKTALLETRLALLCGPPSGALAAAEKTRQTVLRILGPVHPESLEAALLLARAHAEAGAPAPGIKLADGIITIPQEDLASAHPLRREALAVRGLLALHEGKAVEAERLFRQVHTLQVAAHAAGHPSPAAADNDLALALRALGRRAEAEKQLLAADGFYTGNGRFPQDGATVAHNLALVHFENGKPALALPAIQRALSARRRLFGDEHVDTAASRFLHGRILHRLGRLEPAEEALRAALSVREAVFGADSPTTAVAQDMLGVVLLARGKKDEARALFGKAAAAYEKAGMRAAAAVVRKRMSR